MSLIAIYVFGLVCLGFGFLGVKLKRPGRVAGPLGGFGLVGAKLRLGGSRIGGLGLWWILANEVERLSFCGERDQRLPKQPVGQLGHRHPLALALAVERADDIIG